MNPVYILAAIAAAAVALGLWLTWRRIARRTWDEAARPRGRVGRPWGGRPVPNPYAQPQPDDPGDGR